MTVLSASLSIRFLKTFLGILCSWVSREEGILTSHCLLPSLRACLLSPFAPLVRCDMRSRSLWPAESGSVLGTRLVLPFSGLSFRGGAAMDITASSSFGSASLQEWGPLSHSRSGQEPLWSTVSSDLPQLLLCLQRHWQPECISPPAFLLPGP